MTSYPPPYPSSTPPPPPLGAFEQEDVPTPPIAWLVPLTALLAVVGAFLPWFHGRASVPGRGSTSFEDSLYSYADGRIGLLPPIALVVLSISVIGLLRGKTPRRFTRGSSGPVVSAARAALIIGGVSLVCVVIAWFLVPTQYKFTEQGQKVSWNDELDRLHAAGIDASFSRGPQLGYFLTIAAAVLALVAGALMLVMRTKTTGPAQGAGYPPPPGAYPPPGPGPQQWAAPQPGPQQWGQPGYGAPQGYGQQPGYGAPPQGFGPPSTYGTPAAERPEGPIDLST